MPSFSQKFIGVTLPIRMGQTGMFDQSVTIIQQTRSNLKNLILTKKGERLAQPNLGCDIWKILFDQITPETIDRARISVVEAVEEFLPYIEITDISVEQISDSNLINIKVTYRFRSNPMVSDTITLNQNLTSTSTPDKMFTRNADTEGRTIRGTARGKTNIPTSL
jgi:phage baseplate assembly protein W